MMRLEADRMANLALTDKEFAAEIRVVMEERRMRTEDKPTALTYERFAATAYVNSPYHHPVIGWMEDLESMTLDDLQGWYNSYYGPNNATLVVVGDVDPQEVLKLAKQYFGPLEKITIPPVKPQREVEHKGMRHITVKAPAELPHLIMGYKVPVVRTAKTDWEPYALDVLASILDGGNSARFSKNLVRGQEIASGIGASYDPYSRLDELLTISGTPAEGHSVELLEQAIQDQLDDLKKNEVSSSELDRVKAQVVAGKVYERDSVFYQAMQLGQMATVDLDWQLMDKYVEKINAVTAQQVLQVARKYLNDDLLTIAELDPQPLDGANAVKTSSNGGGNVLR